MNLFFLNVGRRVELVQAFRRALAARGGGLIFGSDISPLAPARAFVDRFDLLPRTDDPAFVERLAALHRETPIDLLIPTIDPDLERLDARRDELALACPGLRLLLAPSETLRLARDKRLSRARFADLGAKVPEAIDPAVAPTRLPVFVKPPNGSSSIGCETVASAARLAERLTADPTLMIEAIVGGPEYTVDVLCDFAGKALAAVTRRRLKVRGGEVCQGVVERHAALEALAGRLAEGFGATGPVTVQFRRPTDDCFVAMELNARLGGGLPLTIAAGADWPGWILDLCRGQAPAVDVPIQDGLTMGRYDASLFIPPPSVPPPCRWPVPCQAVLFDLDDTLYPELDFVLGGYRAVAARVWQDYRLAIDSALRHRFFRGERGDLFTPVLRHAGIAVDESYVRQLVAIYRFHAPRLTPHADVAVLDELRAAGFRLGLVTDGTEAVQRHKLAALGIGDRFDAVVCSDALGGRAAWKPSTRPFAVCLAQLDVAPELACYVGDNEAKDFLGPRRLGMTPLKIQRPDGIHADRLPTSPEALPHGAIGSLAELPAKLLLAHELRLARRLTTTEEPTR